MRILSELVFISQTQESDIPRFLNFFIEQLYLIFNQMLSIRAFGRRDYYYHYYHLGATDLVPLRNGAHFNALYKIANS